VVPFLASPALGGGRASSGRKGPVTSIAKTEPKRALTGKQSLCKIKVYYEDTDCMSVVYHANYVKFLERARTEYIAERLTSIETYHEQGFYFMVHKLEMAFHGPARLGDNLIIRTVVENTTRFRVVVKQIISREGEHNDYLVTATVTLVAVDPSGKLIPVPDEFHSL
jgi:tol-pal system-associated acyl-CoA thioesterase